MSPLIYYTVLTLETIFVIFLALYLGLLFYSSLMGAPYVPTKRKTIAEILKFADLKKGSKFLELGCGDGRVSIIAAKQFGADSYGVDINPWLIFKARLAARLNGVKAKFEVGNIHTVNYQNHTVIYIFLMPELIAKISSKILAEAPKNTLIISHGFKIDSYRKYLQKELPGNTFPTYYYRI